MMAVPYHGDNRADVERFIQTMPETTEQRIERVAGALCVDDENDPDKPCVINNSQPCWKHYLAEARAADATSFAAGVEACAQWHFDRAEKAKRGNDGITASQERWAGNQLLALAAHRPGDET